MIKQTKKKPGLFNKLGSTPLFLMILILSGAVALVFIVNFSYSDNGKNYSNNFYKKPPQDQRYGQADKIVKFTSEEDFKKYLEDSSLGNSYYGFSGSSIDQEIMLLFLSNKRESSATADFAFSQDSPSTGTGVDRYSETNVQVLGVDEADIVKTNGQEIYFSDPSYIYYDVRPMMPIMDEKVSVDYIMPPTYQSKTSLIDAWPAKDIAIDSQLDLNGNLLLSENTLIVLGNNNVVYAYNVVDPKKPEKKWEMKLGDNTYLLSSRLYKDKIYLVTSTYVNSSNPCPYKPLLSDLISLEVRCSDIYHPINPSYADSTYTAIALDAQSGEIKDSVSFLASNNNSLVYVSSDNLYITYASDMTNFDVLYEFFTSSGRDLISTEAAYKLGRLKSYDISYRAKEVELETILADWQNSLNSDQRLKLENELENKITDYYKENSRRFVSTGLVKINLDSMDISESGKVPGRPLNQFSLDEYQGNLRIATNIGESGFGMMFFNSDQSANDVYVLDKNLQISGSVEDLGLGERIYSVRFIEDKGYVVTFKQTDPFYVLDLSNPKQPLKTGELKIPGYSSYLHPLDKNKILGIGVENSKLKLSYFDVSDPKNPQEIDKYNLDDYGSETLYDHHAFLLDSKHKVFFLPGYNGGYIFSYDKDKFELVRAVSSYDVKRALYIEDYLYIISSGSIVVLDENNWEEVSKLELKK